MSTIMNTNYSVVEEIKWGMVLVLEHAATLCDGH